MRKKTIYFLSILALAILSQLLPLDWWVLPVVAVAVSALLSQGYWSASWRAFWAGMLVWGLVAAGHHWANEGLLGDRLATTFGLADGWLLVLLSGVWGGLAFGLAGWLGASLQTTLNR